MSTLNNNAASNELHLYFVVLGPGTLGICLEMPENV